MPSLKQLTCNLEWAGTGIPLSEYHTVYLDGHVQTYIAIPELPTPFSVHLTSDGFIAPGLAMFVFMDGEYQCNRNRTGLIMPNKVSSRMNTEIDFRVRQKEAVLPDGSFSGKQWRFEKLNIVSEGSEATSHCAPHDAEYVGMIEVVVLRCQPKREGHLTTPPAQVDSNMRHHIKTTARARYATHFGNHAMPACSLNASSTAPSASDETVGSLFDDSSDSPLERSHFGGDGGWDEPLQPQKGHEPLNEQHQWGFQMTGPDTGIYQPFEQGTPTLDARESQRWSDHRQSRDHFKQDWTQSSGQRPEAPYSQGRDWNSGSNTKGSPRVPAAQSPRAGNTARHGSSEDGRTTSAVPANTGTPAVVINVTQGTSQPQAWVEPSTRSIASKADSWTSRKTPYEGGKQDTTHNGPQMHASSLGHTVNNMPYRDDWHASYNDDGDNEDLQRKDSWETDPAERNWAINWIKKNEEKQRGEARDWTNGNRDRVGDHGIQNYARNLAWRPSLGSVAPDNPGDQVWGGSLGNGTQGEAENQTWKTAEGDASQGNSVNQSWRNKPYEWSRNDQKEKDKAALGTDPYALYSQISPDPGLTQASTNAPNPLAQSKEGLAFPSFPQPEIKFLDPQLPHGGHIAGGWRLDQSSNRPPAAALRPFSSSLPEAQQGTTHKTTASEVPHLMNESDTKTVHKKPYWSTWRNAKAQNHGNTSRQANHALHTSAEGEDPLYTVPEEIAMRKSMSHQVRPGKPIAYAHRTSSPKYMDTYDRPYAVFVFNYRSKAVIEHMFNLDVLEPEEDEKERLQGLSKEEIIERFMRLKTSGVVANENEMTAQMPRAWSDHTETPKDTCVAGNVNHNIMQNTPDNNNNNHLGDREANFQAASKVNTHPSSPSPDVFWRRQQPNTSQKNVPQASNTAQVNHGGKESMIPSDKVERYPGGSRDSNTNWSGLGIGHKTEIWEDGLQNVGGKVYGGFGTAETGTDNGQVYGEPEDPEW